MGFFPNIFYQYIYENSHEAYLLSKNEYGRERYTFSLSNDPTQSIKAYQNHLTLHKSNQKGWASYSKDVLGLNGDTVRLITIPDYSCPSCMSGVLTREEGLMSMKEYGYKMVVLSEDKLGEIEKALTSFGVGVHIDPDRFASYIPHFYNPRVIVIADDRVILEKYLDPNRSQELEKVIEEVERQLAQD